MIFKYFAAALIVVLPCSAVELKSTSLVQEDATITVQPNDCEQNQQQAAPESSGFEIGGGASKTETTTTSSEASASATVATPPASVPAAPPVISTTYFYIKNTDSGLVIDTAGQSTEAVSNLVLAEPTGSLTSLFTMIDGKYFYNTFSRLVISQSLSQNPNDIPTLQAMYMNAGAYAFWDLTQTDGNWLNTYSGDYFGVQTLPPTVGADIMLWESATRTQWDLEYVSDAVVAAAMALTYPDPFTVAQGNESDNFVWGLNPTSNKLELQVADGSGAQTFSQVGDQVFNPELGRIMTYQSTQESAVDSQTQIEFWFPTGVSMDDWKVNDVSSSQCLSGDGAVALGFVSEPAAGTPLIIQNSDTSVSQQNWVSTPITSA